MLLVSICIQDRYWLQQVGVVENAGGDVGFMSQVLLCCGKLVRQDGLQANICQHNSVAVSRNSSFAVA